MRSRMYVSLTCIAMMLMFLSSGCNVNNRPTSSREVVSYTSWDQVYSEPIFHDFQQKTGITVRDKYDVEALKTTGLVQALIAEENRPRCDVFWNNEPVQTCILKKQGFLESYHTPYAEKIDPRFRDRDGFWTGIAARARVILYNREKIKASLAPHSIWDLTEERWKGKCGIPSPLFGTSATQAAVLYTMLGGERARTFFRALKSNEVRIVDGNARLKQMISEGDIFWGIVDTDDANVASTIEKKPVSFLYPDQPAFTPGTGNEKYPSGIGTLVMPNTIMLIKGAPHPEEGKRLIDYLVSREVEERLARSESVQIPLGRGVEIPEGVTSISSIKVMEVSWEEVASHWNSAMECVRQELLR